MAYDDVGHWLGGDVITEPGRVTEYRRLRDVAMAAAIPLARYLAALRSLAVPFTAVTSALEALSG